MCAFQADAIPDWAIYILVAPFIPLAGVVHYSLGVAQAFLLVSATVTRIFLSRRHSEAKLRLFRFVYFPFLLLPNIVVVIWGALSDV